MWVQTECSCHLDHKCPADLSSRNINIESRLSACKSPGLEGGGGLADRRKGRKGMEGRMKGRETDGAHNKFLGVELAKLCVILLSAGFIEGHQTID